MILSLFIVCILGFFFTFAQAGFCHRFASVQELLVLRDPVIFSLLWHLAGLIKLKSSALYTHQKLTAAKAMLSVAGFPVESFLAEWFYELDNHIFER